MIDNPQSKGGRTRALRLTPRQRSTIAAKAAAARWSRAEDIPQAIYGAPDRPLRIADIEIPCYVLEDDQRVIVQSGMIAALGMTKGGSSHRGGTRLAKFAGQQRLERFVSNELIEGTQTPIRFRTPSGTVAFGYEATILADLCDVILDARKAGVLQKQQEHIADRCEILLRGFARIGIIALIDEATGYQHVRARRALEKILDKFLRKELGQWAKRFPDEFYELLFRLRGWNYDQDSTARPSVVGKCTVDIVYARLAPGILEELLVKEPKNDRGRRKHHLHRWLTDDIGHPALQQHLYAVMALMRANLPSWDRFHRSLQRAFPKQNTNLELPLVSGTGEPL